jgi:hypothetical protein
MRYAVCFLIGIMLLAGCSAIGGGGGQTSGGGDTANDPAAAQSFLPTIPGYTATDADSITDALAAAGVGGSLLTGNAPLAAVVSRLDAMMSCYQNVGAIAARVYTQVDIASVVQGQIPKIGALAVINEDRIERNFLSCALGTGGGASAQGAGSLEPCGSSGTITVNNERIHYVFGATTPELCTIFQQQFPATR